MARWTMREVETMPTVSDGEPGDPACSARARSAGTSLLVVGAGHDAFASTWDPWHFRDIPRPA